MAEDRERSKTYESARAAGLIGGVFLRQGLITSGQLDTALEEQRASGRHLGEILVANGWISRLDLASALAEQWQGLPDQGRSAGDERQLRHPTVVPPADNKPTAPETPFDLNAWLSQVQAELEQARPREPVPGARPASFLAFAPTSKGYRLFECKGTSPAVGDQLELPDCDGPLVVSRLTSSPLQFDTRQCAYLEGTTLRSGRWDSSRAYGLGDARDPG